MRNNRSNGFTIAELLVVIAIIGILVAVSIPLFTGQLRKAKVATNKANIRAARAAGIAQYYDDEIAGKFSEGKRFRPRAYYYYDVASGKITDEQYPGDKYIWDYLDPENNPLGKKAYTTASNYEVCSYIIVYVSPTAGETGAAVQTAPYYTDASGDAPGYNNQTKNCFGPDPGK